MISSMSSGMSKFSSESYRKEYVAGKVSKFIFRYIQPKTSGLAQVVDFTSLMKVGHHVASSLCKSESIQIDICRLATSC